MRRSFTLFLVVAVGILAALALADALRPKGGTRPAASPPTTPATTTRPGSPTLLDTLRGEAISGFVLYSDHDCRLHSLLLPRMIDAVVRDEGGADIFHCRFDVDGGRIVPGRTSATGTLAYRGGQIVSGATRTWTRSGCAAPEVGDLRSARSTALGLTYLPA